MPVVRSLSISLIVLALAGCAGTTAKHPVDPDLSSLQPAQEALDEARSARAEHYAPQALEAARQRLTLARDIIYDAARKGRDMNDAEQTRVDHLVDGARLDARLALVQAHNKATRAELQQMQPVRRSGMTHGEGQ